jgi:hypothetical protein
MEGFNAGSSLAEAVDEVQECDATKGAVVFEMPGS